ncbi:RNA-directed DNA polymerase, eukaryota, reverse transcriptase zinc-binding domain protein [Tanacetum coccineum]
MMKNDIFDFVQEFVTSGNILIRCNSSFITLIPKVTSLILCKDYRPISLIGLQYKIIAKLLANRIAKVIEGVISVEQSAFIKGRQILDGPLVVNEVIEWYKKRKKKGLVFKVDFDKAYDSVSWDYILNVMVCMGFPAKWLNWIKGCLSSSRASILVNGSPTKEFSLERGLRQGDPLSPFLFIIAMEGLHVAMDTAMDHGLFRGMSIGLNEYRLSHLLYADDAIFLGEWDENNIKNLITILNCFYLVSGLRLNLSKSNLHGIGVTSHEVSRLANITGCAAARIPFRYLGLPVGSNMGRIQNWNEMIQRISWVKWDSVLNERDKGGLGISSLKASNLALLYKWRWRFMNDHDSKWVKVIKSIHGRDGGFGTSDWKPVGNGVWATIVKVVDQMHEKQIIPLGSMALQLGNGRNVSFWNDIWVGEHRLRDKFPRVFDMESNKECSIAERWVQDQWAWTWNRDDKWKWEFELDGLFSVHSARKIIDSSLLTTSNIVTRWCRNVPIKVNIMMWRLMWDRLPTRMNLADKDIDIPSVLCPICNNELESSDCVL